MGSYFTLDVAEPHSSHMAPVCFYQSHLIVEEFLLDDLAVLPAGDRAELDPKLLFVGGISLPSAPSIGPYVASCAEISLFVLRFLNRDGFREEEDFRDERLRAFFV
jgi:hypothetical protein